MGATEVLTIFFTKVFGSSPRTRIAAGILLSLSSAGNVMSTTFAAVRGNFGQNLFFYASI